jgi:hypothetical protein
MPKNISQIDFAFKGFGEVRAKFDAGPISSDGGALLLREIDHRLGLIRSLASAIRDTRDERYVDHSIEDLLRQRIFQIALGYEDANDSDSLRHDAVLKTCCDRDPVVGADLASQPTFSRLENSVSRVDCYVLAQRLFDSYVDRHPKRPKEIVLDVDITDDPTHGAQQLSFFHGFYDSHVYLPLLVFDQDGDLITAMLQPGKNPGVGPTVAVLERLVNWLRFKWPGLPILVRADGGFASPEMYRFIEREKVEFLIGIGGNSRLQKLGDRLKKKSRRKFLETGEKARLFTSARYRAKTGWPKSYRVLIKAEHMKEGPNVRFVLTNLTGRAGDLYDRYVERAESCENSIKDLKNVLKADRLSCHNFFANQFRLLLHSAAYVLMFELRRAAHGTEIAEAQMDTLRLRLLKIGVRVERTVRRIWFHLTSSHPWQRLWFLIAARIRAGPSTA